MKFDRNSVLKGQKWTTATRTWIERGQQGWLNMEAASCGMSAIAELLDYVVMYVVENERLTR